MSKDCPSFEEYALANRPARDQRFEAALRLYILQVEVNLDRPGEFVDTETMKSMAEGAVAGADTLLAALAKEAE